MVVSKTNIFRTFLNLKNKLERNILENKDNIFKERLLQNLEFLLVFMSAYIFNTVL